MSNKPKKVWLVSEGDYSDYRIEAAFSTEEKAKSFAKVMNGQEDTGSYRVEEHGLDAVPKYPEGMSPWRVAYWERNANVADPYAPAWRAYVETEEREDYVRPDNRYGVFASFCCLARSKEHAIKIGQERLQKHTAQAAVDRGEI